MRVRYPNVSECVTYLCLPSEGSLQYKANEVDVKYTIPIARLGKNQLENCEAIT